MYKLKISISLIFIILVISLKSSFSQNTEEYYQALFILKFLKYTSWTPEPTVYKIGVVGNSSLITELTSQTDGKLVNNKTVTLTKISTYENIKDYDLIYIPKSQNTKFNAILTLIKNEDILIVTEDDSYIKSGASISFFKESSTLKFKINQKKIETNKMQVNSRLLSVAVIVD